MKHESLLETIIVFICPKSKILALSCIYKCGVSKIGYSLRAHTPALRCDRSQMQVQLKKFLLGILGLGNVAFGRSYGKFTVVPI